MISIISPSKSMDFETKAPSSVSSQIKKNTNTDLVLKSLQSLSVNNIASIMSVSQKIAGLNYDRFQEFQTAPEKQALFAYTGDVYKNIDTNDLSDSDLNFAQNHLRIFSALYGILSPLDKIKPYRLEMSNKLPEIAPKGMNHFWKEQITQRLKLELVEHKNKTLINLASNEYSASIDPALLEAPIINMHFREERDWVLRNIALNAKRARGMLSDYIIRNKLDSPNDLKSFNMNGYKFDSEKSDENNFFFIR
ncbi:MAG: YaaA family protein [Rickettsiaceae bacterium]|nr:YaaA family protein [Rickettsiaceae bacterium]